MPVSCAKKLKCFRASLIQTDFRLVLISTNRNVIIILKASTRTLQQLMNLTKKIANLTLIAKNAPEKLNTIRNILTNNNVDLSYMSVDQGETIKIDLSYRSNFNLNFIEVQSQLKREDVQIKRLEAIEVPWFPITYEETNMIGSTLLQSHQDKNHTQFQDEVYKIRRNVLAEISRSHVMGEKIQHIDYLPQEVELWKKIYKKLDYLHQDSMSKRYLKHKQMLKAALKIEHRIPQLQEMSEYLQSKTGFTIKPTTGILCVRQFLNSFAFKLFCSTQFIRNFKNPEYTPEPDIVHEVLGHVTMLADPQLAQLSHKIGLLSLGASDRDIHRLGALYHYTIEFGVCKQANKILGYGAGIASSFGQIQNMMSERSKFQKLAIEEDCEVIYPVHTVQPIYRCTESFEQALKDLDRFGEKINKPIKPVYNAKERKIEVNREIKRVQPKPEQ